MRLLVVPKTIVYLIAPWYKRGPDYIYYGNGKLEIIWIPNNTEFTIKAFYKKCMCWSYIRYEALWKDGLLYKLD